MKRIAKCLVIIALVAIIGFGMVACGGGGGGGCETGGICESEWDDGGFGGASAPCGRNNCNIKKIIESGSKPVGIVKCDC